MPENLDECVKSVLEDNPSYSESRAYAICNAQQNEGNLAEDVTPEDVGRVAAAHNISPECAITLANGEELAEDDPCWEGYTQVGMKTGPGGEEVPNCVPDEDVPDAEGYENSRAHSRVLASRRLAGPIEREELSSAVVYKNIKILSEGAWTDSESREEIYYDPANLEVVDGAPVNVMHDGENGVSEVGKIRAGSAYTEGGDLYADVELHLDNAASEYTDENLQKTLESQGKVGFGGPSVEIPAQGQEIDFTTNPPELEDGKIDGLAFVSQPAARTTAFAQQVQERSVALSDGDSDKGVYVQTGSMSRELMDVDEIRETLDMFGFDGLDEMTDDEVADMAEDLHGDLMSQMEPEEEEEDAEMEEGEEEPEEGMDMGEMMQELESMQQELQELREKEEEMESEMMEMKEHMDMAYSEEEAEELEAELSEAKKRLEELESQEKETKTLAEGSNTDDLDWSRAQSSAYNRSTGSLSK